MKLYTFVVSLPGNEHRRATMSCKNLYGVLLFAAPLTLANSDMEKLTIIETETGKVIAEITP